MTEAEQLRAYAEALASFRHDPYGFVMWAFPWGVEGTDLANETGPDDWQFSELDDLGKHLAKVTDDETFRPFRSMTASGHGIGKASSINDLAITPSGIRRWGDMQAGDLLFGADGSPTEIRATHHFPNCPMMRVTFDDGSVCDVSTGHLWNVRGRQERRRGLTTWRTLETCEIARLGVKRPNGTAEARQWEIPIQGAAQFDARDVPLHPYLVGVWIGDGSKGQPRWGKPVPEIVHKVRDLGYLVRSSADGMNHGVSGILSAFLSLPISGLGSHERFIPDDYKFNTVEVRRALFDGLVDSDGEANGYGSIGYSTTSERLAHDIIWLARSLGCKAMMQPTVKMPQYNGPDGEKLDGRPCWRVTINAPFNPFTHPSKRANYKPSEVRYLTRWIDSIEPIEPEDGMCVTVAAPDGLYQANDFIVTHNSAETSFAVMWALMTCVDAGGVVTANSDTQLRTKTWAELAKWWTLHVDQFPIAAKVFRFTKTAFFAIERPETWRIDAVPNNPQNPAAFAGMHNAGKRVLMLVDEASEIADSIWETIEGAMTDKETELILLGYGNPTKNTGRFREMVAGRQRSRFRSRQIDSRNVKRTNKAEIKEWVEAWGEDSDFVRVRVRGVFPRVGTSQLIGTDLVQKAMKREAGYVSGDPLVAGLDVARMGDDESVLQPRRGRDARTIPALHWRGRDTVDLAGDVAQWCKDFQPEALFIDMGNTGAGVYDLLTRMVNKDITRLIPVDFGGAGGTTNMNGVIARVANKRADMWVKMREWLSVGAIENDPNLETDLTGVQYGFKGADGSEILLESKKAMKARGASSPDWADALCFEGQTVVAVPGGAKRMDQIQEGDKVLTPFGTATVKIVWKSTAKAATTAKFSNGAVLRGKGEHRIFTYDAGPVRLDALSLTNEVEGLSWRARLSWRIVKLSFIGVPRLGFKRLVDITKATIGVTGRSAFFTAGFGLTITAPFHRITTFITEMMTGATTTSTTSNAYLRGTIDPCTPLSECGTLISERSQCWDLSEPERLQRSGMEVQRGLSGTASTVETPGMNGSLSKRRARRVDRLTKLSSSALASARLRVLNAWASSGISRIAERVASAVASLLRTATGRRHIVPVDVATAPASADEVFYNLTLDVDNAYYANGILVFNCLTFAYPVAARTVHTAGERLQAALKNQGGSSFASLMDNAYSDLD